MDPVRKSLFTGCGFAATRAGGKGQNKGAGPGRYRADQGRELCEERPHGRSARCR
jgi:hypothetical protein